MRNVARVITIALALALAACGGSGTTGTSTSNSYQGKTIQLGAILSLTGAGGVYGPSSKKGMDLAVEKINGSGGVNGAKIALDTRDDASDRIQSQQVAQTLFQQVQPLALLGPTLSNPGPPVLHLPRVRRFRSWPSAPPGSTSCPTATPRPPSRARTSSETASERSRRSRPTSRCIRTRTIRKPASCW